MAQSENFGIEQTSSLMQPIGEKDVKFLAAGQKIDDIETAIRELVENSIDADSTSIEIGLTKFGVDTIEVKDNGTGIDKANFDKLAVRYHTSKVKDYKNFHESLQTYGFRGEALSCLCNIANVTIITKSRSDSTGCRLTYKKDGTFGKTPVARDVGTTVILKNIFHSLPVRRRELEMTAKRQYDKVVRMLYEQVLARPHIMFSLSKKTGTRLDRDFTHGGKGKTLEDCLITIFGMKIMDSLIAINQLALNHANGNGISEKCNDNDCQIDFYTQTQPDQSQVITDSSSADEADAVQTTCSADSSHSMSQMQLVPAVDNYSQASSKFYKRRSAASKYAREHVNYSICGYISKIGAGRNSTDSQYMFVNRKPCEIPKVARAINELYRAYNQNQQSPFYCLFITVQNFATDFNVPRKRAVILQDENKLCDLVRETLDKMYSATVPASQKSCPVAMIPLVRLASTRPDHDGAEEAPMDINDETLTSKVEKHEKEEKEDQEHGSKGREFRETKTPVQQVRDSPRHSPLPSLSLTIDDVADAIPDLYEIAPKRARMMVTTDKTRGNTPNKSTCNKTLPGFQWSSELYYDKETNQMKAEGRLTNDHNTADSHDTKLEFQPYHSPKRHRQAPVVLTPTVTPPCRFSQEEILMDGTIKVYLSSCEHLSSAIECDRLDRCPRQDNREFLFAIDPKFNEPAEDQLKLNLNKTSFTEMQVIGQFNCGFILTKLNKHIFIIDQHATDERANYEEQFEHSPMVKQQMAHPKPLYLNFVQENAVINNMDAFKKIGFEFLVDTSKNVGFRVMLSATSICREAVRTEHLGKEDILELIDVAIECPAQLETYTLKKVANLSASIACRKSVMIGDKLTWQQMIQIVRKMSDLKNPWVCAHNRPTIRHLMDTDWKVFDT